jgi:hypothetical protein
VDRRRQCGATLVELLVAFALLSSIAVLSAQLVIQSTRLIDTTARASRNPDLVIATEWIRRDLYEASGVVGGSFGWTDTPLVVLDHGGGWTAYSMVDEELVRTHAPPGGLATDSRVLLRGTVGWRWRVDNGTAVRIELKAFANPEAHRNLTGMSVAVLDRRTEKLTLSLRGKPGAAAW